MNEDNKPIKEPNESGTSDKVKEPQRPSEKQTRL